MKIVSFQNGPKLQSLRSKTNPIQNRFVTERIRIEIASLEPRRRVFLESSIHGIGQFRETCIWKLKDLDWKAWLASHGRWQVLSPHNNLLDGAVIWGPSHVIRIWVLLSPFSRSEINLLYQRTSRLVWGSRYASFSVHLLFWRYDEVARRNAEMR